MISKAEFLGELKIFSELNEDELDDLATIANEYEFKDGAIIAYQRDMANGLYIVRSGRLAASRYDERGIVRGTESYMPGDYFNDAWLFLPTIHPATVKASGPGRILIITEPDFIKYMERNPQVLEVLDLSDEAEDEAQRSRLALPKRRYTNIGLMADELIELETRRSHWRLVMMAFWPTMGLLLFSALFFILLRFFDEIGVWAYILPALPVLIFGLMLLFQVIDWANDYFVITTRHIVHYEFELRNFGVSLQKTPIDQIQSVETVRPNLLMNILNIGTVRVTTAAQEAVVYFDYVDDPETIRQTLLRLRERVKVMDASRMQASMRDSLESYFQSQPNYTEVVEPTEEDEEPVSEDGHWLGQVSTRLTGILPSGKKKTVQGNVATYHRHWIVLVFRTWKVSLVALGLTTASGVALWLEITAVFVALAAVTFFNILWLFWQFEDWRNDLYQVTDRYVIDIDRKPFGFGESRKQAELGNVQNIKAKKSGLVATLFNYGHVQIETAGAQADIAFNYVTNPNRIQAEIFNRREAYRQKQRTLEEQRRRQEYAVLIDVFQQAQEQDRIPRRTPD